MAKPVLEPQTGGDRLHFAESGRFRFDGVALSRWKLPALAAGAIILAVGVGAWTGLESGNDDRVGPANPGCEPQKSRRPTRFRLSQPWNLPPLRAWPRRSLIGAHI